MSPRLAALVAVLLMVACRASVSVKEPGPAPPQTAAPGDACNLFPQYGLAELRCELRPPLPPGDSYVAEDSCRLLVSCELFENTCELVTTPAFDECKACFAACQESTCMSECTAVAKRYDTGG